MSSFRSSARGLGTCSPLLRTLGFLLCLGIATPIAAQLFPLGDELQANTYTTGDQQRPGVALGPDGRFVVVWESDGSSGDDAAETSIQAQPFDSAGAPAGAELQVNSITTSFQGYPAVAIDDSGTFVVVWQSDGVDLSGYAVQGQLLDLDGFPIGNEFQVNTTTSYNQAFASVDMAAGGEFVVAWLSYGYAGGPPTGYDILAQRYDSAGAPMGPELVVNTSFTTGYQLFPSVSIADSGAFVVTWVSNLSAGTDSDGNSIQSQRFDDLGAPVGPGIQVNSATGGDQGSPDVALAGDGSFVVVWQSDDPGDGTDTDETSVRAQRFAADGTPTGAEFQVNSFTTGSQVHPEVTFGFGGDFVVAWQNNAPTPDDPTGANIRARRFGADGTPKGDEIQINTTTPGNQEIPSIATNPAGDLLATWQSATSAGTDTDQTSVQAQSLSFLTPPFFSDGFESGDTSGWSSVME